MCTINFSYYRIFRTISHTFLHPFAGYGTGLCFTFFLILVGAINTYFFFFTTHFLAGATYTLVQPIVQKKGTRP